MEVLMIRDTLVLAILDGGAPFPSSVFATDAMGANEVNNGGFAVMGTEIAPSMAANIWRAGAKPCKKVVKLNGDTTSLRQPLSRLEARIPVCGLPRELLDTTTTEWTLISRAGGTSQTP